jgi:hypothetical protein
MAQQRLLFVDTENLSAYRWRSGELTSEGKFSADATGLEAFSGYLAQHRSSLFSLLADVPDEGFQSEIVPHVRGRDRVAMIKRKLGQFFHGTPLSAAISQGREKTGRRDEKLLYVALTRPQQFELWLAALRQGECQLMGCYTVPLVAGALLDAKEAAPANVVLISLTHGGLRQIFFERGRLRFSRLLPLVTGTIEEAAIAAADESAKLYQYLAGQRLIAAGAPLRIKVLAHPADLPTIRNYCRDTEELRFETIDLQAKARQAGLKTSLQDSHSEQLFLHCLAARRPEQQLATQSDRHLFQLWQLRFAINGGAALIVLASLFWSGKQWFEFSRLEADTAQLQSQIATDRKRYDEEMATLPPVPLSVANLRALVGRYDELARHSASLAASYFQISDALQEAPKIELDGIDWKVSTIPDESLKAGIDSIAMPTAFGTLFAIADIHGSLPVSMFSDRRMLLETVNAFADQLRKRGKGEVRVLSMPFDIESGKTLRSDSAPSSNAAVQRFSLRLQQRI